MVGYGTPPKERPSEAPGHKIPNEEGSCEILKAYKNNHITLTLPAEYSMGANTTVKRIDWLAMYCIYYKHNFGHVKLDTNGAELPDFTSTAELPTACGDHGLSYFKNNGLIALGLISCFAGIIKLF